MLLCIGAFAQQPPQTPEEKEKEVRKNVDTMVERMTDNFKLEDWQAFYLDSILFNDYKAMALEMDKLQSAKVENVELYQNTQDKWMEKMYVAIRKVFNDEQWEKYLKYGAAREKKARDKRAQKTK